MGLFAFGRREDSPLHLWIVAAKQPPVGEGPREGWVSCKYLSTCSGCLPGPPLVLLPKEMSRMANGVIEVRPDCDHEFEFRSVAQQSDWYQGDNIREYQSHLRDGWFCKKCGARRVAD